MHLLIFQLGKDRYALRMTSVMRVLPLMDLKHLPQAPAYVAGLMNYRGTLVPVIDVGALGGGQGVSHCFDTRIVLVDYRTPSGSAHWLGLQVQQVAGVQSVDEHLLADSGVVSSTAPWLGRVGADGVGILQIVELEGLLTEAVRSLLFQQEETLC